MNFDEQAKEWDTSRRQLRAIEIANEFIRHLKHTKEHLDDCIAMEFGCGTGLISFNLKDEFKKIYLVDSSTEMINELNNKIIKFDVYNMVPYQTDLSKDQFNEKVDVIYSSMVFHHIEYIEEIVSKLYHLLNDKGILLIVDLDKEDGRFHKKEMDFFGHNGFEHDELKNIFVKVGFKDVKVHTFYHDVKVIDNEEIHYSLFILQGKK